MVVLAPHGASGTYGQLSDIGADTTRAPRHGFARVNSTVMRETDEYTVKIGLI